MKVSFERFLAPSLGVLAVVAVIASWRGADIAMLRRDGVQTILLALVLDAGVVVTYLYPIHIRYHTKVTLSSIPLYLMALLLPLPLVPLVAGVSTAIEQVLQRSQRGSYPSDMAATTCRWIVVVFLGAWVAHRPVASDAAHLLTLFGAAASMFASDLLTGAVQLALMCHEPLWRVIRATARDVALIESMQYLLGILGALAAEQHIWAFVWLGVPMGLVYLVSKNARVLRDRTRRFLERMADAVDLRDPYRVATPSGSPPCARACCGS